MNLTRLYLPAFDEAQSNSGRTAPAHDDAPSRVVGASVRSRLVTPVLLLFLLGTLDALLTVEGLARGGVELNPIARLLLEHTGSSGLFFARLALLGVATFVIVSLAPLAPRAARVCLVASCLLFALVDLFSLTQLVIP